MYDGVSLLYVVAVEPPAHITLGSGELGVPSASHRQAISQQISASG